MATTAAIVGAAANERLALAEPDRRCEPRDEHLVEKPPKSQGQDVVHLEVGAQLTPCRLPGR